MIRGISYWIFVCGFAVFAAIGFLIGSVAQMTIDSLQCQSSGYGDNNFMALCNNERYGDYEHGALYYGTEPGLRDSIRTAEVIFLGNSMGQIGFSSSALRDYFNHRNIRFFVMGFGYGEGSAFALAVWKKWNPAPKVLVINADPFFLEAMSPKGQEAINGRPEFLWRSLLKMLFQRVHRTVCFIPWHACRESDRGTFRSARNGQWNESQVVRTSIPVTPPAGELPGHIERAKVLGEAFIEAVGVNRNCIVFTGTPNSWLNSPLIAERLAIVLKTRPILPPIDGLSTMDGAHLNPASAERWSSHLVEAMTPIIEECISPAAAPANSVSLAILLTALVLFGSLVVVWVTHISLVHWPS
jgi:hypothetical protein